MDNRCPRQLKDFPTEWCEMAVMRLRSIRDVGRELSIEEEDQLPGCPWAIQNQLCNYCFFKFAQKMDKPLSDSEIAYYNNISLETLKDIEKKAIKKMAQSKDFLEIKELYGNESIVQERDIDSVFNVIPSHNKI